MAWSKAADGGVGGEARTSHGTGRGVGDSAGTVATAVVTAHGGGGAGGGGGDLASGGGGGGDSGGGVGGVQASDALPLWASEDRG